MSGTPTATPSTGSGTASWSGSRSRTLPPTPAGWSGITTAETSGLPTRGTGRLGTIDARDNVHEFQIPAGTAGAAVPQGIVLGPGPYVWFTDQVNDRIGRLDVRTGSMSFTTTPNPGGTPLGLTRGEDGALWFTERSAAVVGRLAPDGTFTQWQLAAGSFPNRIVSGPDGAIWFTELQGGSSVASRTAASPSFR